MTGTGLGIVDLKPEVTRSQVTPRFDITLALNCARIFSVGGVAILAVITSCPVLETLLHIQVGHLCRMLACFVESCSL